MSSSWLDSDDPAGSIGYFPQFFPDENGQQQKQPPHASSENGLDNINWGASDVQGADPLPALNAMFDGGSGSSSALPSDDHVDDRHSSGGSRFDFAHLLQQRTSERNNQNSCSSSSAAKSDRDSGGDYSNNDSINMTNITDLFSKLTLLSFDSNDNHARCSSSEDSKSCNADCSPRLSPSSGSTKDNKECYSGCSVSSVPVYDSSWTMLKSTCSAEAGLQQSRLAAGLSFIDKVALTRNDQSNEGSPASIPTLQTGLQNLFIGATSDVYPRCNDKAVSPPSGNNSPNPALYPNQLQKQLLQQQPILSGKSDPNDAMVAWRVQLKATASAVSGEPLQLPSMQACMSMLPELGVSFSPAKQLQQRAADSFTFAHPLTGMPHHNAGANNASGIGGIVYDAVKQAAFHNHKENAYHHQGFDAFGYPLVNQQRGGTVRSPFVWCGSLPERNQGANGHAVNGGQRYATKVFVGGVPWDVSEVSGFAYVIFDCASSVVALLSHCSKDFNPTPDGDDWFFKLATHKHQRREIRQVQIIPWLIVDSTYLRSPSLRLDSGKTICVSSLHAVVTAKTLADAMNDLFGDVVYAVIDTDHNKYPIGTGRVTFSSTRAYFKAVMAAEATLRTHKYTKKIVLDPLIVEHGCDICRTANAPYFCRALICYKYFCHMCWKRCHNTELASLRHHKPMTVHNNGAAAKQRVRSSGSHSNTSTSSSACGNGNTSNDKHAYNTVPGAIGSPVDGVPSRALAACGYRSHSSNSASHSPL